MIGLLIWLIVVLLIAAAVLGVVRALFALPPLASLAPYTGVIYALIVLVIVLIIADAILGGGRLGVLGPPRWR